MSKKPVIDTFNIIRTRSRSSPKEANVSSVTSRFRAKLTTPPNVSLAMADKRAQSGGQQKVVAKIKPDTGKTKPSAASTSASLRGTKTSPHGQRIDKPVRPLKSTVSQLPLACTKQKSAELSMVLNKDFAVHGAESQPEAPSRAIPPEQRDGGSGETERGAQRTAHDSPEPPPDPPGGLGELSAGMDRVQRRLLIDITAAMDAYCFTLE